MFDEVVNRVGSYCTQWDFVQDRFGKANLLPFTISDMDFKSPKEVIESLHKRIEHGVFGYSRWNHSDYKNAISNWYKKRFNFILDDEWILYSPNVIYSVVKFMELYSKKGEGVLINTPAYDGFFKIIEGNDRKTITSPLIEKDGNYYLDVKDFEEKCKLSKVFIFCNPHNPTGKVWSEEEIKTIIKICKKYNVFIISDEIHMDIVYEGKHIPILKYIDEYKDKIIISTSASKSFNVPAFGGAYILVPNVNDRERFTKILKNKDSISSTSIMAVIATMSAYNQCEYWIEELLTYTRNNMLFVKKYIEDNIPELQCTLPQGCYFLWINFEKLNISSDEFQKILIDIGELAIMPGKTYGKEFEYYLRLNIACSKTKLELCLEKLKKCVEYIKNID